MTRFLIATASVHTTAAACDYLGERLDDGEDALNVVRVRLPGVPVETERRRGDPGTEIVAAAAGYEVDEVVIGAKSGAPGADSDLSGTARHVLANADRPVVVLPLPDPA